MAHRSDPPSNDLLGALAATASGDIVELEGFAAVGMSATRLAPLRVSETVSLPYGSERMYLPGRIPIYLNLQTGRIEAVPFLPDDPSTRIFPVSVFNSPGYVLRHACAHRIDADAPALPLFSYGAVGWYKGKFRSAAICVDTEPRQDLWLMKISGGRRSCLTGTTSSADPADRNWSCSSHSK